VQADAEHQQDHAQLGQLGGQMAIGHKTGGERANQNAGSEVTQ